MAPSSLQKELAVEKAISFDWNYVNDEGRIGGERDSFLENDYSLAKAYIKYIFKIGTRV